MIPQHLIETHSLDETEQLMLLKLGIHIPYRGIANLVGEEFVDQEGYVVAREIVAQLITDWLARKRAIDQEIQVMAMPSKS